MYYLNNLLVSLIFLPWCLLYTLSAARGMNEQSLGAAWQVDLSRTSRGTVVLSQDGLRVVVARRTDEKLATNEHRRQNNFEIAVYSTPNGELLADWAEQDVVSVVPLTASRVALLSIQRPHSTEGKTFLFSHLKIVDEQSEIEIFQQELPGAWACLCASSDGRLLAAGGMAATGLPREPPVVKVWDVETLKEAVTLQQNLGWNPLTQSFFETTGFARSSEIEWRTDRVAGSASALAFSTDNKHLLIGTSYPGSRSSSHVSIIEAWATDKWLREFSVLAGKQPVFQVRGSSSANHLAWTNLNSKGIHAKPWGEYGKTENVEHDAAIPFAIADQAARYAVVLTDGSVTVHQWGEKSPAYRLEIADAKPVSIGLSKQGNYVAVLCLDRLLVFYLPLDEEVHGAQALSQARLKDLTLSEEVDRHDKKLSTLRSLIRFLRTDTDVYEIYEFGIALHKEAVRLGMDPTAIQIGGGKTLEQLVQEATTQLLDRVARRALTLGTKGHVGEALRVIDRVLLEGKEKASKELRIRHRGIKGWLLASVNRYVEAEPLTKEWVNLCDERSTDSMSFSLIDYVDSHIAMAAVEMGLGRWGSAKELIVTCTNVVRDATKDGNLPSGRGRLEIGRALGQGANLLYQITWASRYRRLGFDHWEIYGAANEASTRGVSLLSDSGEVGASDKYSIVSLLSTCAYQELMLGNHDKARSLAVSARKHGVRMAGLGFDAEVNSALCTLTLAGCERGNSEEKQEAMERTVDTLTRVLGPESPTTVSARLLQLAILGDSFQANNDTLETYRVCGKHILAHAIGDFDNLDQWKQLGLLRQSLSDNLYLVLSEALRADGLSPAIPGAAEWLVNFKGRSLEATIRRIALNRENNSNYSVESMHPQWIQIEEIRRCLKEDEVFIDLARYCPFDTQDWVWQPSRYLAFVITSSGESVYDLGPCDEIDTKIQSIRSEIQSSVQSIRLRGEVESERRLRDLLDDLSEDVFHDLRDLLRKKPRWIVSPDATFWFLPWEMLSYDGSRYCVEDHVIRYVATAREMLKTPSRGRSGQSVIVANPFYESVTDSAAGQNVVRTNHWHPLPGTLIESKNILPSLLRLTGGDIELFTEWDATEKRLRSLSSPRVLVLATHAGRIGLETEDRDIAELESLAMVSQPAGRVFEEPGSEWVIALAGANYAQRPCSNSLNGILTASEVTQLDLRGTELVVLSACDTGLGDYQSYAAPLDLRRAFRVAGSGSVLASVWKVPDQATSQLMSTFFHELASGKRQDEALCEAERQAIEHRRVAEGAAHPLFWAGFTLTGAVRNSTVQQQGSEEVLVKNENQMQSPKPSRHRAGVWIAAVLCLGAAMSMAMKKFRKSNV